MFQQNKTQKNSVIMNFVDLCGNRKMKKMEKKVSENIYIVLATTQ
jgi:hypothetical protein